MIELIILRRAESDVPRICNRLEDFQVGRGEEFLRRIDLAFARLQHFPEIGAIYHAGYRRLLLGQLLSASSIASKATGSSSLRPPARDKIPPRFARF